jgi:hypothetical protein
MKNVVFWDVTICYSVKTDESAKRIASINRVTRIGKLGTTLASNIKLSTPRVTANVVPMKNGVFWDVTPCGSCKNRRIGGT